MEVQEVHNLIEKSILSGRQMLIDYTNSKGIPDTYLILAITSTWANYFNTVAESVSRGKTKPFNKFRYDRISSVDITDELYQPNDNLIEKLRDGSLFSDIDNQITRKGGIKGYPSSINYVSASRPRLNKFDAKSLIAEIPIAQVDGWIRGIVLHIQDGDTYDLLLESDPTVSYVTRLFGVDTPECHGDSVDLVFGLEAKVFVEDMFASQRYCYARDRGKDAFRRNLMDVLNSEGKNIAIELLENGLGVPMMGYCEDKQSQNDLESATKIAYENQKGLWSLEDVSERYNNIISDKTKTKIDLLDYLPEKRSAISRYLHQNPRARIVRAAFDRTNRCVTRRKTAEEIFDRITKTLDKERYDIDSYKAMCDSYLIEIHRYEQTADSIEDVKDFIMHLESMIDELELGDGQIKGNFSKGKNKLIYHDDPDDRWYKLCIPEIRFRTANDAKYCGFRKRKKGG